MNLKTLRIYIYPDPVLRRQAQPVEVITDEIRELAGKMIDLMIQESGIGLAAPQVGISQRMIVISVTGAREDAEVFINPIISDLQGTSVMEEGCLSVPGIRANVSRAQSCTVTAQNLNGERLVRQVEDLAATVFQHECDHLDGTLFIDRLSEVARIGCRKAIKNLEKEGQNR